MSEVGDAEHVFVIHGVNNRNEKAFEDQVKSLGERVNKAAGGSPYAFHAVYWGNLQPTFEGLKFAIPGLDTTPWESGEALMPAALPGDEIGSGFGFDVPKFIGGLIDKGSSIWPFEDRAERATTKLREATLPGAADALGDLFIYVDRRQAIQQRLRDRIAHVDAKLGLSDGARVSILGHSLGGIAAFDAACSTVPNLWIKHLVTFGSQSAVLHILDPRQDIILKRPDEGIEALDPFRPGHKTTLPPTVGSWLSIWHAMDPLAFLAGKVFNLHDGSEVIDRRIEGQERRWSQAHSSYWWHSEMPGLVAAALAGQTPPG